MSTWGKIKINIEELEESKRVKLIAQLVTHEITHKDLVDGLVEYCEECNKYEKIGVLYECVLIKSCNELLKNFVVSDKLIFPSIDSAAAMYGISRQVSDDGYEESDEHFRIRILETMRA